MNDKMQDLMYQAGLTAQGCWDEMDSYDHTAIEKFAKLIVRECAEVASVETSDIGVGEVIREYFEPPPIRQVTIEESVMGASLLQERLNKD